MKTREVQSDGVKEIDSLQSNGIVIIEIITQSEICVLKIFLNSWKSTKLKMIKIKWKDNLKLKSVGPKIDPIKKDGNKLKGGCGEEFPPIKKIIPLKIIIAVITKRILFLKEIFWIKKIKSEMKNRTLNEITWIIWINGILSRKEDLSARE